MAQFNRFIELTGKKPEYLHEHSISSENYRKVIHELSVAENIPYSTEILAELNMNGPSHKLFLKSAASMKKVFDPMDQLNKDTVEQFFSIADEMLENGQSSFICHPGYVDSELLGLTTLSIKTPFPGIALDEKTTVSPGIILTSPFVPFAILLNAAIGSP